MDMNEYYKQLEGFKIKSYLGESEDGFPQFQLTKPKYADILVEVSADEEGNYGGFLFITDAKEEEELKRREEENDNELNRTW